MPNEAYFSNICPKSDQEFLGIPLLLIGTSVMSGVKKDSQERSTQCNGGRKRRTQISNEQTKGL